MKQRSLMKFASCALLLGATITHFTQALAQPKPCPWIFSGSIGYGIFLDMYKNDGQTALGRFAVGKEVFKSDEMAFGSEFSLGLELGVQTGNSMRLGNDEATLDLFGLPIQSTIKPTIDILATLRTNTLENVPVFMQLKAGVAYRQWQFQNIDSINTLSKIAPELQFGVGYLISDMAFVTLSYQGMFGGNPDLTIYPQYLAAKVNNIPSQNALLLGFSLTL